MQSPHDRPSTNHLTLIQSAERPLQILTEVIWIFQTDRHPKDAIARKQSVPCQVLGSQPERCLLELIARQVEDQTAMVTQRHCVMEDIEALRQPAGKGRTICHLKREHPREIGHLATGELILWMRG